MCGIAGIVGKVSDAKTRVSEMLRALEHRGPDDNGIFEFEGTVLGHRRLSVFDLSSAGHQPMLSENGDIGIVFNGAIYNFRELRDELEAGGRTFHSATDTEVLLQGYEAWGIRKLVEKIDGMFAFAVWESKSRTVHLVRDRLGVKPLVFHYQDGNLAFASTVRALRQSGFTGEISREGLIEYLEFGFVTDQNSIFDGVEKLAPATILTIREGKRENFTYWELEKGVNDQVSFEDAVRETERLFLKAVEKRLFADVPVGALLSGGIDSSLVCWAVAKLGGDVTAFTVGVPGDVWDETMIAAKTARDLGINHRIIEISGETPIDTSVLSNAYAEPFACASALGLIDISGEVRKHATVLLTGDGGDDIFLGYPEHLHFFLAESVAKMTPQSIGGLIRELSELLPDSGRLKRARSWFSYAYGGLGGVTRARDGLPAYKSSGLLGEALNDAELPDRLIPLEHGSNLLAEFMRYDMKTRFTGEYLPKVDGGTMFHGLEARSPFLDSGLWEFANTLPYSVRLHKRNLKAVLREIVRRRISPELAAGSKK